jgi:hypothetical protein
MNAAPELTVALGWLGTVLVIASYAQSNLWRLRVISMVASVALVIFNVALGIWSNVVLELALVGINVVRLVRRPAVDPAPGPLAELKVADRAATAA